MKNNFSYKEAENRLKEILSLLSSPDIDLSKSLELYKEGKDLLEKMKTYIDSLQAEINK